MSYDDKSPRSVNEARECVALGYCPPAHKSTKDRRWCGGKPGREHVYEWRSPYHTPQERACRFPRLSEHQVCTGCGKDAWNAKKRYLCGSCGTHWPDAPRIGPQEKWRYYGPRDYTKVPSIKQWHISRWVHKGQQYERGEWRVYLVCPGCGEVDPSGGYDGPWSILPDQRLPDYIRSV